MILDRLENAGRYTAVHRHFTKAFDFLRNTDFAKLASGRHEIHGTEIYAMVAQDQGHSRDQARLEVHRKYIDIQLVLSGTDEMGWKSLSHCTKPEAEYDAEKDYRLFTDAPDAWIAVGPGAFTVFFPDDAHAPMVSPGQLHKVVVKVAV